MTVYEIFVCWLILNQLWAIRAIELEIARTK